MISTFLGYQLYGNNIAQSLSRTAAEPVVSQAQAYYNANIGKVKSASDLVNNYQLLSYATKAFGLSDMTYAKALLTKVLESDLTDPKSVANQLNDSRYTAFAQAFNFSTTGVLKTPAQLQTSAQQTSTENLFAANTTLDTADAATATTYYKNTIGSITSLGQLEKDPQLLGYVLVAYGIDPTTAASTFEQTLESDLSSKTSFVNQQAGNGYLALSKAFEVNGDGSAATLTEAQTDANVTATTNAYTAALGSTSAAQKAGATETSYYLSKIGSVTQVSDITGDPRLLAYVSKAYGLPGGANAGTVTQALESDLTDATSYARTSSYPAYKALAQAFNFTTSGTAGTVTQFQSSTAQLATEKLFTARQTSDDTTSAAATAYYEANIGSVKSVGDLKANSKLLNYVLTAYGIDPASSSSTIASVIGNTNSIATTTPNASLLALQQDFNVTAAGDATNPLTAESAANITLTTAAYMSNAKTDAASQAAAKTKVQYYKTAMANVTSVSSLLADPRLVAFVEKAYAIPTTTATGILQQVLTSNVADPKSVANTKGAAFNQLAAAFDFTSTGLIGHEPVQAQSKAQLNAVNSAYLEQQMESEAGQQNPGIALALYLQQNASKVTDAYSILADKKLSSIFQTILGLPATSSAGDIDSQAKTISSQINLADLKDPAKVSDLVQRFSILYDLNPPASTADYNTSSLFSGGSGTLDVTSLFGVSSDDSTDDSASVTALF